MRAGTRARSRRPDTHRALALGLVAALLLLGYGLLATPPYEVPLWGAPGAIGLWSLGFAIVGALVTRQQPRNGIGRRLLLAAGLAGVAFVNLGLSAETWLSTSWTNFFGTTASWVWAPTVIAFSGALVRFPDGRLPGPRWRAVEPALWTVAALLATASVIGPAPSGVAFNPLGVERLFWLTGPLASEGVVIYLPLQLLLAASIAAPFWRYRTADPRQRRQLRLLGVACLVVAVSIGTVEAVLVQFRPELVAATWITSLLVPLVPISMGVAILRHNLFDVDRLLSRTLAYLLLTAMLTAVYVGSVVILQAALAPFTPNSDLAVAGSTLTVAALFGPSRRWAQRLVDRRFNRDNYDSQRAIAAFGQRLRDEVDLDEVVTELTSTLSATVQPATVSLWFPDATNRP